MLEQVLLCAVGWVFHLALAGMVILGASYLGRGRVAYQPYEWTVLLVPYGLWLGLTMAGHGYAKNLDNLLVEPCVLAACIAVAAILRVALATWGRQDRLAFWLYLTCMAAAAGVWRYVPPVRL